MQEITIYCSARDQGAHVLVDHDPLCEGDPSLLESGFYCLEIGVRCSGSCPLGGEPVPAAEAAGHVSWPPAGAPVTRNEGRAP